jgi:tetratricopeptide (TPR) repeat protein
MTSTGFPPPLLGSLIALAGWLLFLLLGLSAAGSAAAKSLTIDADTQYGYAQHLFEEGRFEAAAHEFDRFVFFFADEPRVAQARFQIGTCLFNLKRFASAEAAFLSLLATLPPGPLATRTRFMITDCRLRENNPSGAVRMLRYLIGHATGAADRDEAWRRLGWMLVEGARWQAAREAFDSISPEGKKRFSLSPVLSKLDHAGEIPQKKPTLAGFLSVLPGAGHLYCDRPHDAAIAFVLNAALIGVSWEAFDRDLPWLGSLLAVTESGIYAGTIYSALNCAHKYNRDQKKAFIRHLQGLAPPALSLAPLPGGFVLSFNLSF